MNLSTGFVQALAGGNGYHQLLSGGKMELRTGTPPESADDAATGTLLATLTKAGGTLTWETRAEWKIIIAGSSGSVDTIKIGLFNILPAAVSFTTDLATTAAAIAAAINNNRTSPDFEARSDSDKVYIKAPISSGTGYNSVVCTTTATTMTATVAGDGTPSGSGGTAGVAAANGLEFQFPPVAGVLTKATDVWQDSSADASGTVGYIRHILESGDDGTESTAFRRVDYTVGVSGADINGATLTTTAGAPAILNTFAFTVPKSES